jgi:hypothetical protein
VEAKYLYSIWDSPPAVFIYLTVIALAGVIIYLGSKWLCAAAGAPKHVARTVAATMGLVTAPWAFLIPTSLFYRWF